MLSLLYGFCIVSEERKWEKHKWANFIKKV